MGRDVDKVIWDLWELKLRSRVCLNAWQSKVAERCA
jgi:hypothetical protein